MSIEQNLQTIRNNIAVTEKKFNRSQNSVKLMAVSKFNPQESVLEAIKNGQLLFGENRVQEAYEKFLPIIQSNPEVQLHIIGQLQTNKVKKAVEIASCIQSVDRIDLLKEIEKQCSKINKTIDILFEIHTGEESKSGYTSEELLFESLDALKNNEFPHINPCGFMTMAPFSEDKKLVMKSFTTLKALSEKAQTLYPMFNLTELSMGMSGDYELAIEAGSTLVRVGTAIFGERDYSK